MTSSSKRVACAGRRGVEPRRHDQPRQPGECAHVDEGEEGQPVGADARQLGRHLVAAQRIDAPADRHARRDERVEQMSTPIVISTLGRPL